MTKNTENFVLICASFFIIQIDHAIGKTYALDPFMFHEKFIPFFRINYSRVIVRAFIFFK